NQYDWTVFEISDCYWPYHRCDRDSQRSEEETYVDSIRSYFLSFGCVSGRFGAADEQMAKHMCQRGIPLGVIEGAMLLGACRKYVSWFNHEAQEPIQSLHYFESIIAEIQAQPLPAGYTGYLRWKIRQYALKAQSIQTSLG